MDKKNSLIFLVIFFAAVLFLPDVILAANYYPVSFCAEKIITRRLAEDKNVIDTSNCPKTKYICYEGIVPCGRSLVLTDSQDAKCPDLQVDALGVPTNGVVMHCQLCHFFIMIDNLLNFVLIDIVPILAVLMLAIAGLLFFFGGAKPNWVAQAKSLIKGVVIGLFLIYGAYMIVGEVLTIAGLSQHNPLKNVFRDGVFTFKCPIYMRQCDLPPDMRLGIWCK